MFTFYWDDIVVKLCVCVAKYANTRRKLHKLGFANTKCKADYKVTV